MGRIERRITYLKVDTEPTEHLYDGLRDVPAFLYLLYLCYLVDNPLLDTDGKPWLCKGCPYRLSYRTDYVVFYDVLSPCVPDIVRVHLNIRNDNGLDRMPVNDDGSNITIRYFVRFLYMDVIGEGFKHPALEGDVFTEPTHVEFLLVHAAENFLSLFLWHKGVLKGIKLTDEIGRVFLLPSYLSCP